MPAINSRATHRSITRYIMLSFLRNSVDMRRRKDYADSGGIAPFVKLYEIAVAINWVVRHELKRYPRHPYRNAFRVDKKGFAIVLTGPSTVRGHRRIAFPV